jgi:hypothetical protein
MKRYFKAFGYLLSVHVLALLVMTLFRLVEFIALHGMIVDAEASRVMAFVKGVWFDNVIACYISVLPVAVLLVEWYFHDVVFTHPHESLRPPYHSDSVLALWGQPLTFANVFCVLTFIRYVSITIV